MICFALYSANRASSRTYAEALAPWKLTYPQYLVLMVLWTQGGVSVRQMGELLQLDSGTLSPLLKRLETRGYVTRTRRVKDSRLVDIDLTDQGKELEAELSFIPEKIACSMGITSLEQAEEMLRILHGMTDSMRGAHEQETSSRISGAA